MQATLQDANDLLLQGSLVLADIEANGIRIDVDRLHQTMRMLDRKIAQKEDYLQQTEVFKLWKKIYGADAKLSSTKQLGRILFDEMKVPCHGRTATGLAKVDEEALEEIDHPFVKEYIKLSKLKKVNSTFLAGIQRETIDGYLHPFYNLNTAISYRSSSSEPNFQNFPIRNEKLARMIRSLFIPRDGYMLVEIDFKGIEVMIAACYHKDPTMLSYLRDPTSDMHRDLAVDCYMIPPEWMLKPPHAENGKKWAKDLRYCAKNKCTFPLFYGSYYVDCAKALWAAIDRMDLHVPNGDPLKAWLEDRGIDELGACDPEEEPLEGTFEAHIQKVEEHFWNVRFPVYAQWKRDWYDSYLRTLEMRFLTGFRVEGLLLRRNQVVNYPIQGSAFHCLLWTLIQVHHWLRRRRMRTRLVGQVHDSALLDAHPTELAEVLDKVVSVVRDDLPKHWSWIIVPLEVEVEASQPNASWHEKETWVKRDGIWKPRSGK